MSKVSKVIVFIGFGLLCLSFIISRFNVYNLINPFININKDDYKEKEYTSYSSLDKIVIDIHNENIKIIPTSNDYIKITYYESDNMKYIITEDLNKLNVARKTIIKFFNFNWNFLDTTMIVEIPEEMIINYDIKTSNAFINIENLKVNQSKFVTSNDNITLENIQTDGYLELKTSNASIELDDVIADDINVKTSNDKIIINYVEANSIKGSTSNDNLELTSITADEINLKSSNGSININNIDARIIYLKTSNDRIEGDIIGTFDEFQKDIRTSNDRIEIDNYEYSRIVDKTTKDRKLTLKTSNGKIDIRFTS